MKKRLISLLLACVLTMSCICVACAETSEVADEPTPTPEVICVDADGSEGGDGIMPLSDSTFFFRNSSLYNEGLPSKDLPFNLSNTFGYAKIWIRNDSSQTIQVTTYYNSSSIGDGFTISAGAQKIIYIKANGNYGDYITKVHTINGATLYGETTVKVGTKEGVDYPY